MDNENMAYTHNGVFPALKNPAIQDSMDGPGGH